MHETMSKGLVVQFEEGEGCACNKCSRRFMENERYMTVDDDPFRYFHPRCFLEIVGQFIAREFPEVCDHGA